MECKKIKYNLDSIDGIDGRCSITNCPDMIMNEEKFIIKVGSLSCFECKHHIKRDKENQIVYCSYKYTEPNEFQKEINYLKKRIEKLEGKL